MSTNRLQESEESTAVRARDELAGALNKTLCDMKPMLIAKYGLQGHTLLSTIAAALLINLSASVGATTDHDYERCKKLDRDIAGLIMEFVDSDPAGSI